MWMYSILAQTTDRGPSWLEGSVALPFEWVGLVVGLLCLAGLIYFARRAAQDVQESQAQRELRDRRASKDHDTTS